MKLRFWKKEPTATEVLEEINLEIFDEAMALEHKRGKKRIYEV